MAKLLREIIDEDPVLIRKKENEDGLGDGTVHWYDIHHKGKHVGNVTYHEKDGIAKASPVLFSSKYRLNPGEHDGRGKGLGPKIYKQLSDKAKSNGRTLVPSNALTDDGMKLWKKHQPDAVKNHKYNKTTGTWGKD